MGDERKKERGEILDAKVSRDSKEDSGARVRRVRRGIIAEGSRDLRCSCKEVLRRDKAPAITIEPRGNSLRTCVLHAHMHALARRVRSTRYVGFRSSHLSANFICVSISIGTIYVCICEKIRGYTPQIRWKKN